MLCARCEVLPVRQSARAPQRQPAAHCMAIALPLHCFHCLRRSQTPGSSPFLKPAIARDAQYTDRQPASQPDKQAPVEPVELPFKRVDKHGRRQSSNRRSSNAAAPRTQQSRAAQRQPDRAPPLVSHRSVSQRGKASGRLASHALTLPERVAGSQTPDSAPPTPSLWLFDGQSSRLRLALIHYGPPRSRQDAEERRSLGNPSLVGAHGQYCVGSVCCGCPANPRWAPRPATAYAAPDATPAWSSWPECAPLASSFALRVKGVLCSSSEG